MRLRSGRRFSLRLRQKDGQAGLTGVGGPVTLRVVHGFYVHLAGPEGGVGDGHGGVATSVDRHHEAGFALLDKVDGHAGEGGSDHTVDEIGGTGAEVVGEVADDVFFARLLLNFVCQDFGDVHLFAMTVG